MLESISYDLIIGDATQICMRMKIDKYKSAVKVRRDGVTESLNLEYEPEIGDETEDDFTSETDTEAVIGGDSDDVSSTD